MGETVLRGIGASFGRAVGKAIVIDINKTKEMDLNKLEGKVLVARYTSPELTPIFLRIKGVVTEDGAILSHAAIVSREFRVPCVIGVRDATKKIKNGDVVEVNADDGTVRIIKK